MKHTATIRFNLYCCTTPASIYCFSNSDSRS